MNINSGSYTYEQFNNLNVLTKYVDLKIKNITDSSVIIERFEIKNILNPLDINNVLQNKRFPFFLYFDINDEANSLNTYTTNNNLILYTQNLTSPINTYQSYPYRSMQKITLEPNAEFNFSIIYAPIVNSTSAGDKAIFKVESDSTNYIINLTGKKNVSIDEIDTIDFILDVSEINGLGVFELSNVL